MIAGLYGDVFALLLSRCAAVNDKLQPLDALHYNYVHS